MPMVLSRLPSFGRKPRICCCLPEKPFYTQKVFPVVMVVNVPYAFDFDCKRKPRESEVFVWRRQQYLILLSRFNFQLLTFLYDLF